MNKKKMLSTMLIGMIFLSATVAIIPTASASGPKSIYGYVYINDKAADAGIKVKIEIDGDNYDDLTDGSGWYDIGLPSGYEGKIGYFKVTNKNIVPDDNQSVFISSETGYIIDLHVTISSGNGGTGGTGGTGGEIPTGPSNQPPVADASASQTSGFIGALISFDGSLSSDSDGTIDLYEWDWNNDGNYDYNSSSPTTTHSFNTAGSYPVTLRVTDNDGVTDEDTVNVMISKANTPPTKPEVDGPTSGHQNTGYTYTAVSTDADNDTIQYIFDWGDDSGKTTTDFLQSGISTTQTHSWITPGRYVISVKAYDNETLSGVTQYAVLIDVHYVKDIGYLIDNDSDGTYDSFYSNSTGKQTGIKDQGDGAYLIDNNGDGGWGYVYDVNTDTLTEYAEPATADYTLLIILVIVIILILIVIGYLLKQRKNKDKE